MLVWLLRLSGGAAALLVFSIAAYWVWYAELRSPPDEESRTLFEGVTYRRAIAIQPPVVVHEVTVRLNSPGLRFLVTPPDPLDGRTLRGQTVEAFLERHDLQLAVNGDFFEPWYSNTPWDYYPRSGEAVDPQGLAASSGEVYANRNPDRPSLFIDCAGAPSFERPADLCHAISGAPLLTKGAIAHDLDSSRAPRSAVGLSGTTMILLVVDGRQPGYSEGMGLVELAERMLSAGALNAINLDGGGSSTLVAEDAHGDAEVLNSPIHTRIVGRQRPVANHLGIYVGPQR